MDPAQGVGPTETMAIGSILPQSQQQFGDYIRSTNSQNLPFAPLPRTTQSWATGFDLFWELDVWGKFRRSIESADASFDASIENYDAILISLLAETASTYVELRTAQQRLEFVAGRKENSLRRLHAVSRRFDRAGKLCPPRK